MRTFGINLIKCFINLYSHDGCVSSHEGGCISCLSELTNAEFLMPGLIWICRGLGVLSVTVFQSFIRLCWFSKWRFLLFSLQRVKKGGLIGRYQFITNMGIDVFYAENHAYVQQRMLWMYRLQSSQHCL